MTTEAHKLQLQRLHESNRGRPRTDRERDGAQRGGQKRRGRPFSDNHRAALSLSHTGLTYPTRWVRRCLRCDILTTDRPRGLCAECRAAVLIEQGGGCAICGRSKEPYHTDHDHETNQFRGLLCALCNLSLGWWEKNGDTVQSYLTKSQLAELLKGLGK